MEEKLRLDFKVLAEISDAQKDDPVIIAADQCIATFPCFYFYMCNS